MTLVQFLLIVGLLWGCLQLLLSSRHYRLVILLTGSAGVLVVLAPGLATTLANRLGIGRGSDLILYMSVLILGMLWVRIFKENRDLEQNTTILAREVAFLSARRPSVKDVDGILAPNTEPTDERKGYVDDGPATKSWNDL